MSTSTSVKWQRLLTEALPAVSAVEQAARQQTGYSALRAAGSGMLEIIEVLEGVKNTFFETSTSRIATGYAVNCRIRVTDTGQEATYPIPAALFKLQDGAVVAPNSLTFSVNEAGRVQFAASAQPAQVLTS